MFEQKSIDRKDLIFWVFLFLQDEGKALLITLVVACIIFGLLLVASIIIYFYLRIRMDRRLQRLPSDHHELTLQGPIIEVVSVGYLFEHKCRIRI